MKTLIATLAALLAVPLAAQNQMSQSAPVQAPCTAPEGWGEVVARDPDFVVFGEIHGTTEAPALVESLICAEAERGQRLLLAVEHSSWQNAAWQEAWALPHEAFRLALPDLGWRGREDGVASEAMLALVTGAHALKENGAAIDIVAFNGARDDAQRARFADLPSQGPHEAAQAENIAEAAAAGEYDRVIVLVGGLHAMIRATSIGGPKFDPMAVRLQEYGPVVALDMKHAGGSVWNCQRTCAEHRAASSDTIEGDIHISLGMPNADPWREYYDGYYWLGPISASPPAAPQ